METSDTEMMPRTGMRHWSALAALALAWLLVAGVTVQIFLAGLALFDSASRWSDHKTFGMMLGPVVILLTVAVLLARPSRAVVGMGIALLVLYIVQINLLNVSTGWVAALHPLVGFAILGLPIDLAQRLWRARRAADAAHAHGSSVAARRPSSAISER